MNAPEAINLNTAQDLAVEVVMLSFNETFRTLRINTSAGAAVADIDAPGWAVIDRNRANEGRVLALFGPVDGDGATVRDARLFLYAKEAIDVLKALLQEYQHINPTSDIDPVVRGRAVIDAVEG